MNVYVIGAVVAAFVVSNAFTGFKSFHLGRDAEKASNVAKEAAAREVLEATRKADQAQARQTAKTLQAALTKQKGLSHDLGNAMEAHIRAIPAARPDCPAPALTDSLWDDWNSANHAGARSTGGSLPSPSGASTAPAGAVPGSGNPEPR